MCADLKKLAVVAGYFAATCSLSDLGYVLNHLVN